MGIESQFAARDIVAAMDVGKEGMATVAGPFDRPSHFSSGPRNHRVFGIDEDLGAEAPANIVAQHRDPILRMLLHLR